MGLADGFRGIIFDYGGVLVEHQTRLDEARLAAIAGIPRDFFVELYWSDRKEYDRGAESGPEYWEHLGRRANSTFTSQKIEDLIEYDNRAWMHFDEKMFAWVQELKQQGKKTAVLSNMPQDLGRAVRGRTQRFALFDHVTLSYEVGAVKPEPAIYEHCLHGLGIPPQETLFIDDRVENCRAAEALGMNALQFTSREEILPKLL